MNSQEIHSNTSKSDEDEDEALTRTLELEHDMIETANIEVEENEGKSCFFNRISGIGLILIFIRVCISGLTNVLIKKFDDIDSMVLLFYRSLVNLAIILPWSVYKVGG